MDAERIIDDMEQLQEMFEARRRLGHSTSATSVLPIEGTIKCSRIVLGFDCGSILGVCGRHESSMHRLGEIES